MENIEELKKYKKGWFACAVTRDFEMKVYRDLVILLEDDYWKDYIYDMFIPLEEIVDKKGNKKLKIVSAYKGVIYINMLLTQEVYSRIKIDGFRTPLPASEPMPIPEEQIKKVLKFKKELSED